MGDRGGSQVTVGVNGRTSPPGTDPAVTFLRATVEIQVGSIRGCLNTVVSADGLALFRTALAEIDRALSGAAELNSLDGDFYLRVVGQPHGALHVEGQASESPGSDTRLYFTLDGMGLSDLTAIIDSLDECSREFPLLGQPA